jgi:hypothetical protein
LAGVRLPLWGLSGGLDLLRRLARLGERDLGDLLRGVGDGLVGVALLAVRLLGRVGARVSVRLLGLEALNLLLGLVNVLGEG